MRLIDPRTPGNVCRVAVDTLGTVPNVAPHRRRWRFVPQSRAASPVPNTARPLAAERPYLQLSRADHARAIEQEIERLDQRLASAHDPTGSAVQIGRTERFVDPYKLGRITYLTRLVGGEEVIVIIPMRAESTETFRCAREIAETVMAELEPAPVDD